MADENKKFVIPQSMVSDEPPKKRFIRTYASDMAKLSGTSGGQSPATAPSAPQSAPQVPMQPPLPPARPLPPPIQRAPMMPQWRQAPHERMQSTSEALPIPAPPRAIPQASIPAAPPRPARETSLDEAAYEPPARATKRYSIDDELAEKAAEEPLGIIYEHTPTRFEKFLVWLLGTQETETGSGMHMVPPPSTLRPPPQMVQPKLAAPTLPSLPPKPAPVQSPPPPVRPPTPAGPPVPYSAATAVSEEVAERKAILERLKARMAANAASRQTMPPPAPVQPAPQPALRPPPPAPVPLRANVPPPLPYQESEQRAGERLHTYSRDFGDKITAEKASTFSVYAADADTKVRVEVAPRRSSIAYVIAASVLVVGGSLAVYFAYQFLGASGPVATPAPFASSLIAADEQTEVSGTSAVLMQAVADAAATPLTIGNVRLLSYTVATTTITGTENLSEPGGALVRALQLPAPDILLRNIRAESTVGVIHAGEETRAFFLLSVSSYERTFAGMLSWEPNMASDLGPLYPAYAVPPPSDSTSTLPAAPAAPRPSFVDEVVESHDVRALKDGNGSTILLYGYRDQNTLVVARDEAAFSAILNRLSATRTQ